MSGVVSAMVSWQAGHGSARALAQSVISLPPAKSCARDVVCRVTSKGPGLNLSPSTAVPGLVGLYQQTAGPLGPLKTPVFSGMSSGHVWRCVCDGVLASRARECSDSGAVGNVPAPREIQCQGGGLSGNPKGLRVEPKPEHYRARLGGALPTNSWAPGPVENPGIFRCVQRVCLALCLPWCPGEPGTGVLGLWRSR